MDTNTLVKLLMSLIALVLSFWKSDLKSLEPRHSASVLVSENKPVVMSSVINDVYGIWKSKLAVDGNLGQSTDDGICAGTVRGDNDPKITLNLENPYRVSQINVNGPSRCQGLAGLTDVRLYLSDTSSIEDGVLVHTVKNYSGDHIPLNTQKPYQYVIATRESDRSIIICEIQVFALVCMDGYYGDCDLRCGNCKNSEPCNKSDGRCVNGCADGYTGSLCKTECANGTYGEMCSRECGPCRNGTDCHHVSGTCLFCADGFTGHNCSTRQSQIQEEHAMPKFRLTLPVFITTVAMSLLPFVCIILVLVRYIFKLKREVIACQKETVVQENISQDVSYQLGDVNIGMYETLHRDQGQSIDYEALSQGNTYENTT